MWHVACGMWHVASGMWHLASGMWHLACGMWRPKLAVPWCTLAAGVIFSVSRREDSRVTYEALETAFLEVWGPPFWDYFWEAKSHHTLVHSALPA